MPEHVWMHTMHTSLFKIEMNAFPEGARFNRFTLLSGQKPCAVWCCPTYLLENFQQIPGNLLEILKQIRGTASNRTWFLSGKKSKPVEPRSFRKSIHLYLEQAGVHSVHPHMLRHSFATICLQAGCDIKTLSELMGHSSADITMKRYVHTNWTRMKSEMNRIFGLRRIGSLHPSILHE